MNSKQKILVIDDEEGIRDTLETILSLDGYDVTTAVNGEEGIKSAEAHIPDLIICDIMMPVMDGYEVAKRVRENKEMVATPFLFLSAKASHLDFRKGLGAGADDYLVKPFRNEELLAAIEMRLKRVKSLTDGQKSLEDSINNAKHIQDVILPMDSALEDQFKEHFKIYRPRDVISGDFYWLKERENNNTFFAVADCTGHGVPGAMLSMVCYDKLNAVSAENKSISPGKLLTKVNGMIYDFMLANQKDIPIKDGMDIALCEFDSDKKSVVFSGAARPLYIITDQELVESETIVKYDEEEGKSLYEVKGDIYSIGASNSKHSFTEQTIPVQENDRLYLFSDGYTDQFGGPKDKKLNRSRLRKALLATSGQPIEDQKEHLESLLNDWKGKQEQTDDITLIGIEL